MKTDLKPMPLQPMRDVPSGRAAAGLADAPTSHTLSTSAALKPTCRRAGEAKSQGAGGGTSECVRTDGRVAEGKLSKPQRDRIGREGRGEGRAGKGRGGEGKGRERTGRDGKR